MEGTLPKENSEVNVTPHTAGEVPQSIYIATGVTAEKKDATTNTVTITVELDDSMFVMYVELDVRGPVKTIEDVDG